MARSDLAVGKSSDTVIRAVPKGLDAPRLKSVLREFVSELPETVASALRQKPEWGRKDYCVRLRHKPSHLH